MDKKRAIEILLAHACCVTFSCSECPWKNTEDCSHTAFTHDLLVEAINVVKEELEI